MAWAKGNQGNEKRLVNQGDFIGVQGAINCIDANGVVLESRNRVTGLSMVSKLGR